MANDNQIDFTVRVNGGAGLGDVAQSLGEVEAELKGVGKESSTAGTALGEMARQQRLIDSFVRIKQETVAAGAACARRRTAPRHQTGARYRR